MSNHRIMFLRDRTGSPVGCLAIKTEEHLYRTAIVSYQLSVLNPADRFDREMARTIALGRLIERPIQIQMHSEASMHEITSVIMNDIRNDSTLPSRARRAANLWMRTSVVKSKSVNDSEEY